MMFFEIHLNCDEEGGGGERYCEDGEPVAVFNRADADRIVLDLMAEDFTLTAVVVPVKP